MKDKFSAQAKLYAKYRPRYPEALFDFILIQVRNRENAWDCATGNGQTASVLAGHFKNVFATDISQKQIDQAEKKDNIHYSVQPASQTNFSNDQFDLVTVSQALHWFANDEFYREVKRVARRGAPFVAWAYSLLHISPAIDPVIQRFYSEVVGPYWDDERRYVDEEYKTIPFPFREIGTPTFTVEYRWTPGDLEGYLNTWSALQNFVRANQYNPVDELMQEIRPLAGSAPLLVRFPLHLRMGLVEK
jgi:SAM-dependent methyltransferase